MSKLGVAVLGLDHWYTALDLAAKAARGEQTRLVAVVHDDQVKARQLAGEHDTELTTDYRAVLDRADVNIVVVQYSTEKNLDVCRAAAAAGKHIIGVKPMAMDLTAADAIVEAVRSAGIIFLPYETVYRLTLANQRIKTWLDEGRIGQPLRYFQTLHTTLPQAWPGSEDSGWWIDPTRVPGGGWLDHAIYAVDTARWLFDSEMRQVLGVVAKRRHTKLPIEDYGYATFTMANDAVAAIEDTWTSERDFFFSRSEVVGSAGAIFDETRTTGRLILRGDFGQDGWMALEQQQGAQETILDHMVACVREERAPIATVEDGRANLAACLAFYQAARSGACINIG
jgi:predicted dehydrogenase